MDIIQLLLNDKREELLAPLIEKAGFSADQAQSFLPPVVAQVKDLLLGASGPSPADATPADLLEKIDPQALAKEAGIDPAKAQSGLQALLPTLLSLFQGQLGSAGGIGDLAQKAMSGGLAGAASKLFGR